MVTANEKVLEFEKFITEKGPWDLWVTITSRRKMNFYEAKSAIKRFFKYLNSRGEMFIDMHIFCFICFERDMRGGVHIHALVRGIHPVYASRLQRRCFERFGQSRVVPYVPRDGAALYVASKFISPYLEDYDFLCIHSRIRNRPQRTLAQKIGL